MLSKCYLHREKSFRNQVVQHNSELQGEDCPGKILKQNTSAHPAMVIEFLLRPEVRVAWSYKVMTKKRPKGYMEVPGL